MCAGAGWVLEALKPMLYHPALNLIFRALADPTRRHIFERLCDEDYSVTALAEPLPISLQAVLHHVRVLESGGLIHTEKCTQVRSSQVRMCRLEPEALCLLERWLSMHRGYWERRRDIS